MLQSFYWGTIRKAVTAFGVMFNNIYIDRVDDENERVQSIRIPLAYAPRHKFLAKLQGSPNSFEESFQSILPRMSFEYTKIYRDSTRKISPIQKTRAMDVDNSNNMISQYAPTPYNMEVALYIYAKNQDDALQIVEQILPYFNPDYNLNLKTLGEEVGITNDLPMILNDVQFDDTYEGDLNDRRMIIWTMLFTLKLNFYGPMNTSGVIKRANVNIYNNEQLTANIMNYVAEVSPFTANITDNNYSYIEFITDF